MEVSGKFLADSYDVHPTTIQRWAKDGVIGKVDRDRYVLESADLFYIGKLQEDNKRLKNTDTDNPLNPQVMLTLAQCRKVEAEAELKEIELQERKRELISYKEAVEDFMDAFSKIKAKFCSIPQVASNRLAGMEDPKKIDRYLESLIDEALEELSESFRNSVVEIDLDIKDPDL